MYKYGYTCTSHDSLRRQVGIDGFQVCEGAEQVRVSDPLEITYPGRHSYLTNPPTLLPCILLTAIVTLPKKSP